MRLALLLALLTGLTALAGLVGLAVGSEGFSLHWADETFLITQVRAPRTLGALLAGALLGLAGALAQGLFRNPLADPYLLGAAAGASLGVVGVLAAGSLLGLAAANPPGWGGDNALVQAGAGLLLRIGLVAAAFAGALLGVGLTLLLAGGTARPLSLLLCGVVVGVVMGALTDLLVLLSPEALRGKQSFLLGTTGFLGWGNVLTLGVSLLAVAPPALRFARVLDALVLGEASAISLGLNLGAARLLLVVLMALATGSAVSQVGLVAFVGLMAPHLVRRCVVVTHGPLLALSALTGALLLGWADVAARWLIAPQELPVGVLTALLGGAFLLLLLRRQRGPR